MTSILDLPRPVIEPEPFVPPKRKRIRCVFCSGYAFVDEREVRLACRECRHAGLVEPEYYANAKLQREDNSQ